MGRRCVRPLTSTPLMPAASSLSSTWYRQTMKCLPSIPGNRVTRADPRACHTHRYAPAITLCLRQARLRTDFNVPDALFRQSGPQKKRELHPLRQMTFHKGIITDPSTPPRKPADLITPEVYRSTKMHVDPPGYTSILGGRLDDPSS